MAVVPRIKLGSQGLEVSKLGLGCMGMSAFYGPPKPMEDMIHLIHEAVNMGVTFLDTADIYGPHTNEILVGKAIKEIREKVQLATKFAVCFDETGKLSLRGDPEYVRAACDASLKRLDVDYIDLYYQHRVDPKVPIEITVGAMKQLVKEGKVKYIGLSEVSSSEIRRAHAIHPITAVQLEWSLWTRDVEEDIIPTCRELGIGIVPYGPLGGGFFSGKAVVEQLADGDFRKTRPKFLPENIVRNKVLYERLSLMAAKRGCAPGQLALAWVLNKGNDVAPIPGTTKLNNLIENVSSLRLCLSKEDMEEIEEAVPFNIVAGNRLADMSLTWKHLSTPPLSTWQCVEK